MSRTSLAARPLALLLAVAAASPAAGAQTITFDDLPSNNITSLTSYAGFDWTNIVSLPVPINPFLPVAAGSAPNVMFPGSGNPSGFQLSGPGTFTLVSIGLERWGPFPGTASPTTTVTGFLGATPLFSMLVTLDPNLTTTAFGWSGIDRVTFDQQGGGWFAADDIVVGPTATTAPEPATVALLGGGLLALGAVARRRRR